MNDEETNKIARTLELLRVATQIWSKTRHDMSIFAPVTTRDVLLAVLIDELQQREKEKSNSTKQAQM